jgi:Flp pilus assembly pilin Flp
MNRITDFYVHVSEKLRTRFTQGQTMTEYALILSAVAVVVYSGYKTMGITIKSVLTTVDGSI